MKNRRHFITRASAGVAGIALFPARRLWSADQTGRDTSSKNPAGKLRFALCNEMFEHLSCATILYGPGMGDVDYGPIAAAVRAIGWNKWLSVEVFKHDPDSTTIARKSIEYLKRYAW